MPSCRASSAAFSSALGKTVVIVTHDMLEALALADRVAVLDQGALIACEPPETIVESTRPGRAPAARRRAADSGRRSPAVEGRGATRDAALLRFWLSHRAELAGLIGQHVMLVGASTAFAVAFGVPLGIFAARRPRLSAPLVGLANLVQTIPSLAMFGFLLPLPLLGGVGHARRSLC